MLSQRLSKDALALLVEPSTTQYEDEMRSSVALWERTQRQLQEGDPRLNLPGRNSAAVTQLFARIQPNFLAMRNAVYGLLDTVDAMPASRAVSDAASRAAFAQSLTPYLDIILANESDFLTGMNAIVAQYQHEAEGRVTNLRLTV